MLAFVVAAGDSDLDRALPLAERLDELGFEAGVVMGPDPSTIDRAGLGGIGRWVDVTWLDVGGRTLTAEDAARMLGHEAAWEQVRDGAAPALVLEARVEVGDGLATALDQVSSGVGTWEVLHLAGDDDRGAAYLLTPSAAGVLLEAAPDAVVPVAQLLARVALDGFDVSPAVVTATPTSVAARVLTDHLVVVSVAAADVAERATSLADELDPGCVVVVLPAGTARMLGSPEQVLAGFAELGAPSMLLPGPTAMLASGGAPLVEVDRVEGLHVHVGADRSVVMALDGRLLDVVAGTEALVLTTDDEATLAALEAELADLGSRDVARLLRYHGAADDDVERGLRLAASEILTMPFWTPAFCATVARAAEAVGAFAPADDDPVPGHEISLALISPRLYAHLEDDLAVRVLPLLRRWWPCVDYHGLRDAFVIKYAPGAQEELRIHHDVAQLSASIKLNDGYVGAELEFPRQGWSNAGVPVGHLVVWPSLVTHPHRTRALASGVKYGLTIWMELPGG